MSASPTPTPTEDAPAPARGRPVASKPLNTPSATRSTGSAGASASATRKPARTASAASSSSKASTASAKAARTAAPSASSRASSKGSESGGGSRFPHTKTTSSASTSQSAVQPPVSSVAEQQPARTSDPLQVAAQVYPWTYMTSTLDACFKDAEVAATHDLETRAKELSEEESELAEQRDRLEAERAIDFFEELGSGTFAKEAPGIMQLFSSHGDSCARAETEALKLAMRNGPDPDDEEPLKAYNDMLQVLEELQHEATSLQDSITKLTESPEDATVNTDANATTVAETTAARSQVTSVFASCLPVLRARSANLAMAQELIDTALENVSLGLRMESMGIA
ncbi:hypothetical protein BJ912DRAFT_939024 [Pholiota molesta]|nr:hypothetical protein BJ912DRAFT_939024 [Pholiota molesta]